MSKKEVVNPIEELTARAQADEARDQASVDKVKRFNPKQVLGKKIHTVNDEVLGEVQFGDLTIGDAFEINKMQGDQEKGLTILYLMLKKAEPSLTWNEMKEMPFDIANRLLDIIGKQASFLRPALAK